MKTILIIDDEDDIREILGYNLRKEGYNIIGASNGKEGIELAQKHNPDLIILDVMMPEMDGIEVCQQIRLLPNIKDTRICFLTARNEDYSQIAGFDAGGDYYVPKPIKPKVMVSRVNAILRRNKSQSEKGTENLNSVDRGIIIDRDRYLVITDGVEIQLPRKEFELLALLTSKPGKVFERDFILDSVWGTGVVVGNRTIDVHIRKLREKIGDGHIQTIKGVGYKFKIS